MKKNRFKVDTSSLLLILALACLLYYGLGVFGHGGRRESEVPIIGADYVEVVNVASYPLAVSIAQMERLDAINKLPPLLSGVDWSALAPGDRVVIQRGGPSEVSRMSPRKRIALGIPIDINSATQGELEAIPGIGEVRARKIIELRTKRGGISSLYDLLEIEGFGVKRVEALSHYATAD